MPAPSRSWIALSLADTLEAWAEVSDKSTSDNPDWALKKRTLEKAGCAVEFAFVVRATHLAKQSESLALNPRQAYVLGLTCTPERWVIMTSTSPISVQSEGTFRSDYWSSSNPTLLSISIIIPWHRLQITTLFLSRWDGACCLLPVLVSWLQFPDRVLASTIAVLHQLQTPLSRGQ